MISSWRGYIQLARLPAVFTAISNVLAAHLIATEGLVDWVLLLLLVVASACVYCAGMILNDCFDIEEDRRDRPDRPLPSGLVSLRSAWVLGISLLLAGILLALISGQRSFLICLILVVAVLLYDGVLKHSLLGPWIMGLCRYLNWLLGFSIVALQASHYLLPIPIFLYVLALTWISRQEAEASSPSALWFAGFLLLLASAAVLALYMLGVLANGWFILVLLLAFVWMVIRLTRVYGNFNPDRVQGLVKSMILLIIPLDALLVAATLDRYWLALWVLVLLLPGRWLAKKIYIT